jgi:hypothetical protein
MDTTGPFRAREGHGQTPVDKACRVPPSAPPRFLPSTEVHQRPFQAQKGPSMSTTIHQNLLLSIGFAVSFAVKNDQEKSVFKGPSMTLMK